MQTVANVDFAHTLAGTNVGEMRPQLRGQGLNLANLQSEDQLVIKFGGNGKRNPLRLLFAFLYLAPLLLAGPVACASQTPSETVTHSQVYEIEGRKDWTFGKMNFDVDKTSNGWEIRGKQSLELSGYKFTVTETENGWHIRGNKDLTFGDYYADIVQTGEGEWLITGDEDYTPIGGDFSFEVTKTDGGYRIEGKKAWTFGQYNYEVSRVDGGWKITGGHNWDLRDFEYVITDNSENFSVDANDEEGLLLAFPVIMSMIRDAEEEAE